MDTFNVPTTHEPVPIAKLRENITLDHMYKVKKVISVCMYYEFELNSIHFQTVPI